MNAGSQDSERSEHDRLKESIKDELLRTLDERAQRLGKVENLGIVPDGVFGAPSSECLHLFRDGHYYGCISLVQAVAEAIIRHVWQVKLCKKQSAKGNFDSNLKSLHKKGFIDNDLKAKISKIWEGRDSFHHLNPNLEKEMRELEELAAAKLHLLGQVEKCFFEYDIVNGVLKPKHPEYWHIQRNGLSLVYVRGGL